MATKVTFANNAVLTAGSWGDLGNVYAEDGACAVTLGVRDSPCTFTADFPSSSIPAGSVISSVAIRVKFKVDYDDSTHTLQVSCDYNGSARGTYTQFTDEPTTLTALSTTTVTDCTLAELNSANMGATVTLTRTSFTSTYYSIDYVAIVVDYITPTAYTKSLSVSAQSAANMDRKSGKMVATGVVTSATFVKKCGKIAAVIVTGTASAFKGLFKTVTSTITGTASSAYGWQFKKVIAATVSAGTSIAKSIKHIVLAMVSMATTFRIPFRQPRYVVLSHETRTIELSEVNRLTETELIERKTEVSQ